MHGWIGWGHKIDIDVGVYIYIFNYIDIHMYVCVCEVCMFGHVFRTVPPAWITEMAIDV